MIDARRSATGDPIDEVLALVTGGGTRALPEATALPAETAWSSPPPPGWSTSAAAAAPGPCRSRCSAAG